MVPDDGEPVPLQLLTHIASHHTRTVGGDVVGVITHAPSGVMLLPASRAHSGGCGYRPPPFAPDADDALRSKPLGTEAWLMAVSDFLRLLNRRAPLSPPPPNPLHAPGGHYQHRCAELGHHTKLSSIRTSLPVPIMAKAYI